MYKVLFAEDELLVRLGMQNSIPWETYHMELCAQADNGLQAFELFQEIRPDVVITDIGMEGMNGIELIENIRKIDEECAIIVISCWDDFETLRRIIPYKIIGYILKASMDMEEIFSVLQQTQEYLQQIGRGCEQEVPEEQSLAQCVHSYLIGKSEKLSWNAQDRVCQLLNFYLPPQEQEKINELAMKFIYELVERQLPDALLLETGVKEFCLLLSSICSEELIETLNHSIEGFLGVRFFCTAVQREEQEDLRTLWQRLQKRRQAETVQERQWDKLIQKAVCYMREHHQELLSLTDISREMGISPSYFSCLFKKETGKNYVEFLNEIRLEKTLEELKDKDYKISVIAEQHGFHNQEYFSRFFKKAMGVSPAKWRQQNR